MNEDPGALWARASGRAACSSITITRGKVVGIKLSADPERLRQLELAIAND